VGIRRIVGAAVIAICVIVPAIEAFDTWDHTLRDGNDTEANVVVASLCVGLALTIATRTVIAQLPVITAARHVRPPATPVASVARRHPATPLPTCHPPPLPLRI
jgi:hypothetical protein